MATKEAIQEAVQSSRSLVLTPLRYPGSKRRQARLIAETILANPNPPTTVVEAFAGGASVSLFLLEKQVVEHAILGELDPLVAAFWKTVKLQPEKLIEAIELEEPTVANWDKIRKSNPTTQLAKATKLLFLNRTSYGGVVTSRTGPIGGRSQKGHYDVACRFALGTTKARIRHCATLAEKILFVHQGDYKSTVDRAIREFPKTRKLYYFDPPFFEKADRLYRHHFSDKQHIQLRDFLRSFDRPWILSYDDAPRAKELYGHVANFHRARIHYTSATGKERLPVDELLISNLETFPKSKEFVSNT